MVFVGTFVDQPARINEKGQVTFSFREVTDLRILTFMGGHVFPRGASSIYYSAGKSQTGGTLAMTENRAYFLPFYVARFVTLDQIGLEVTTGVAATTVRLGIYKGNNRGAPGTVLLSASTVDSSTAAFKTVAITQPVEPGLYYLVAKAEGGTPTVRRLVDAELPFGLWALAGNADETANTQPIMFSSSSAGAYTANPAMTGIIGSAIPNILVRV